MKICISFYVVVVIEVDKLMISQCWMNHKASQSCLGCDNKDLHERLRVYMCVHVLVSVYVCVFSLIFETLIMIG